uniref:Uncharacterized protein n=1 Tax=Tetraselmis sp. GSL018 TaxID=582737 RepID=A0A061RAF7_9CHLO
MLSSSTSVCVWALPL